MTTTALSISIAYKKAEKHNRKILQKDDSREMPVIKTIKAGKQRLFGKAIHYCPAPAPTEVNDTGSGPTDKS